MKNWLSVTTWQGWYTRNRRKLFVIQAIAFVVLGLVLANVFTRPRGKSTGTVPMVPATRTSAEAVDTLWTCSMHPQIRKSEPGLCPLCNMPLIPAARSAGGMRTLKISPEAEALMQLETSPVERKYVTNEIRMVGKVDYDETRLGYITAWVPGRLDRLYVDFTGIEVRKGEHMVSIYSEQLYSAQEELIQALKYERSSPTTTNRTGVAHISLADSAREKLRLLGLTDNQIQEIEQRNTPSDHITIFTPVSGVVIEKLRQEGERVQLGDRIYTISDLSLVWVHLDAYESDLPWIRYGQDVTITTEAYPGEEFHGRISFIQPVLNDKTRTVMARVNVPNADGKLKPKMFVHATVHPKIASGGKVMDASLAGKWISPMHPEIVSDEPGNCPICGMPLVRAESLGYVAPESNGEGPPLVIPYLAALVTGTRAIVYVQLPTIPSMAEPAYGQLLTRVESEDAQQIQQAFSRYAETIEQPCDELKTDYAKQLWNEYSRRLLEDALAGERATTTQQVEAALSDLESTMTEVREHFAPVDHPTFDGREIVLGPRAGDYYLVERGLEEGELVVTQGNFKIDAEIQIQAKPSMMTPEGGGGGGHVHGGHGAVMAMIAEHGDHAQHQAALSTIFTQQLSEIESAFQAVAEARAHNDLGTITAAFVAFGKTLDDVDASSLQGQLRMVWNEMAMLLGNDAAEGGMATQTADVDRVFGLLSQHMQRLRTLLGVTPNEHTTSERIAVSPQFQFDLGRVWDQYTAVGEALAADNADDVQRLVASLESAVATVNDGSLGADAKAKWSKERSNLDKIVDELKTARDIKTMRTQFRPLSEEVGVLAKTFGFGEPGPIYELHCPMAFQGTGAIWYQTSEQVRNPYFGSTMLKCADRIEKLVFDEPDSKESGEHDAHQSHSAH